MKESASDAWLDIIETKWCFRGKWFSCSSQTFFYSTTACIIFWNRTKLRSIWRRLSWILLSIVIREIETRRRLKNFFPWSGFRIFRWRLRHRHKIVCPGCGWEVKYFNAKDVCLVLEKTVTNGKICVNCHLDFNTTWWCGIFYFLIWINFRAYWFSHNLAAQNLKISRTYSLLNSSKSFARICTMINTRENWYE